MAVDPRVSNAFRAMKALGIPPETVKPVLKNLLKLYNKKWELIEEDNYRTLADAIFECADDKVREDMKEDTLEYGESEPPFKKPHLVPQEDQVSSTPDNGRTEPSSHSLRTPSSNKGKDPISSEIAHRQKNLASKRASSAVYSNWAVHGTSLGHNQREYVLKDFPDEEMKQPVDDLPRFAVPSLVVDSVLPGSLEGSTRNNSSEYLMSHYVVKENKDRGSAYNYGTSCGTSFDIASSPLGEVKICLNCNPALGQSSSSAPHLDSVLKSLEDKYLRSYKIVGSQFSVTKLLKELCESYLEQATDSIDRSEQKRTSAGDCLRRFAVPNEESPRSDNCKRDLNMKESHGSGTSNVHSLVTAQHQPTSRDKRKPFRKISDITKGTEKVQISLLDEIGNEHLPNFIYIPTNTIYQNAFMHVSLARIADEDCCSSCIGDCLSSSVPCACARDTGGEFAYTPEGLLKAEFLKACISMNQEPQKHYNFYCEDCPLERAKNMSRPEPCKGHLVRKFIKECWRKCGCNMQCGNRVVQRGISCKLQVFLTKEGKGWGLRALEELPRGAFVCEYVGEILTNMELYERNKRSTGSERHTYPVLLDADWGSEGILKDEDALCLDATYYGNVARFINHRCFDANLLEVPVEVEAPDHHYYHLAFFTKRKIGALEELTWDYGIDFDDDNHPIKAFRCCCASAFCRDKKRRGTKASVSPIGRATTATGGGTIEQLSS